ncbi:PDR/VanB family oxidoreductase [Saccharothrix sp. Mg75]|uniref:PDR/VanB family oxidoreductase n=1 Tax=Saccharothrix sp. Mg75 TaxID=3445357 RepID=UPI003EE895DD
MTMNPAENALVELVVVDKSPVADDVVALTLRGPARDRLPEWAPGAHVDLVLPGGLVRQYSLCGDRWDPYDYRVAVLRDPAGRGGSVFVHDGLRVGDRVSLGGPRNNFRLVPSPSYLFVAGGIGITPLLPMVRQAELVGADWRLLYGGRSLRGMAFLPELAAYGDKVVVVPQDVRGLPDLAAWLPSPGSATKVYCCGPAALLRAVEGLCAEHPPGQVRTERFVPEDRGAPARDEPFEVELRRSGRSVVVAPGQSVLDALNGVGVAVLSSCRRGTCGTCETTVLGGEPDHRDSILDDAERASGDCLFPCVSRSRSDRLVLDL